MASYIIEREQVIPRAREEVFEFFSRAENLEELTPGFLHFEILTPRPIRMEAGTVLDYRIVLYGVPVGWKTLIELWEPERRFVDMQARGPFRRWRHMHAFDMVSGGTLMRDRVDYELPLGPLGGLVHAAFVRRSVKRIFDYRRKRIKEIMG